MPLSFLAAGSTLMGVWRVAIFASDLQPFDFCQDSSTFFLLEVNLRKKILIPSTSRTPRNSTMAKRKQQADKAPSDNESDSERVCPSCSHSEVLQCVR